MYITKQKQAHRYREQISEERDKIGVWDLRDTIYKTNRIQG